ncbi:VpsF family polysaccharide biosynthesis protein [Methylobacterium sp. J-090]|uniref:VpsF family polysaccharide biosynthesis protein n=1 Tax=Methylobacterium sp. J-090 TaxID=2836666 RepID=UPI001FBAF724|nr:VpsF family polysaccharide biosynthesis protein [Methylobacterium sp. J-090]MCJ2081743.1 VpsF family polysaccharide biosynthesis protein [Methylobacterium sp. J-090]
MRGFPSTNAGFARERPALHRLRVGLTVAGVVLTFAVSSMLLATVGYHYETSGGLPFEKFHPGTLMVFAAFALLVVEDGPDATVGRLLRDDRLSLIYVACLAFYMLYVPLVLGRPVTFIVDTLMAPAVVAVLLARTDPRSLRIMDRIIHGLMAANAVIGSLESLLKWRLVPYYIGDEIITFDWRSTALLGHPLQNAGVTAVYALLLLTGLRGGLPARWALPAFVLQLAALPAFGGRTAAAGLAAAALVWLGVRALLILSGRRFALSSLLWVALLCPLVAAGIWFASGSDYVALFVDRFVDDSGSAETRVRMLSLFGDFSWGDLFIGPDPETLAALQIREGLELGLESFVVAFLLTSGIFASSVLFLGLGLFVIALGRLVPWQGKAALGLYLILNVTSTGFSSKGVAFSLVVMLLLVLTWASPRGEAEGQRRRASAMA